MPYLGRLVILWSTSSPAHRIVLIFWQEVQSCLSAHDFYAESLGQLKGQQVPRSWWRGHPKRYFKTTKFPIFQGKVMKSRLHPWSLTWNLKISPWKRRFLLEIIIFRFHVKLWGCSEPIWFTYRYFQKHTIHRCTGGERRFMKLQVDMA